MKGFIQLIVILIVIFVIMSLLGISLTKIFSNKTLADNWHFIKEKVGYFYSNYLKRPVAAIIKYFKEMVKNELIKGIQSL